MDYLVGGLIMGAVFLLLYKDNKAKQKVNKEYEEAIIKKFPQASQGYRWVKGIGNIDHVYTDNKLYSVVFSKSSPPSIVYSEEHNTTKIHEFDDKVVKDRLASKKSKERRYEK